MIIIIEHFRLNKMVTKNNRKKLPNDSTSTYSNQVKLFDIAVKMKKAGLSDTFVVNAVRVSLEFEGVADLMHLWAGEDNKKVRDEIIADIQEMIDECAPKEKTKERYVKFNDLDAIAKNIRAFKDSLLQIVNERGGLSKLSELTDMPQPSLSRFFNSNAMPQRSTVLKIAKALGLGKIKMDSLWGV
jgi:DNA-binding phage protein